MNHNHKKSLLTFIENYSWFHFKWCFRNFSLKTWKNSSKSPKDWTWTFVCRSSRGRRRRWISIHLCSFFFLKETLTGMNDGGKYIKMCMHIFLLGVHIRVMPMLWTLFLPLDFQRKKSIINCRNYITTSQSGCSAKKKFLKSQQSRIRPSQMNRMFKSAERF